MIAHLARWYDGHPLAGDASLAALMLAGFVLPSDLASKAIPSPTSPLGLAAGLRAVPPHRSTG